MNRIGLCIVVPALLLIPVGCKGLIEFSPSSFFSNFSLEELVKKNRSPSGMICTKGGSGGSADHFSIVGPGQSSSSKSSLFSCEISDDFDEADLIASLKTDVEQALSRSGATIVKQGSLEPMSFYFDYSERDVHGRINIEGKQSGANYYSLEATLDERSGGSK